MEAALLASAAEILETEGPDGLSVRRIAAAAHVAPMGVYNHFDSKYGIVEALFIQGFERLGEAMATHRRHRRIPTRLSGRPGVATAPSRWPIRWCTR